MKKNHVNRLVFSSSATVYGNNSKEGFDESQPTGIGLTNPYGKTKYMIEEILMDEARNNPHLKITILRYFNPVGAHPSGLLGEDPNGVPNNLMPLIMQVYEKKRVRLQIFGNDYPTPDGTCIRDYIHVLDLAKGHLKALQNMNQRIQILNLGTGKGTSVLEIVKKFEQITKAVLPTMIIERREGDLPNVFADPTRAQLLWGWRAQQTIEDAIRDTLKYSHSRNVSIEDSEL